MEKVPLLNVGAKIQLFPGGLVFSTVVIPGLKFVATIEIEFPHVLTHGVTPDTAAGAIANVVVNPAIIDQRTPPSIEIAAILAVPGGIFDRAAFGNEMVCRQAAHLGRSERLDLTASGIK